MAKGMMSRPPTGGGLKELSARQQRRKQYLERRGREFKPSGQVSGQPTEMPEMTARQQRRQQYLARRDARRQRAVEDWRSQQQAQRVGNSLGELADFNEPNTMENPYKDYTRLTDRELYEMGYDPRDYNIVSRGPTGQISSTLIGYDMSPLDPQERERLWQERLNNPRPTYSPNAVGGFLPQRLTPEQLTQARTMFSGGFGGQGYGNMMGQLPAGQTQGQAMGAAMGQRGVNAARPYGTNHWSYSRR